MEMEQTIHNLKEIAGVFGVCIYERDRGLLINKMPPFFVESSLVSLGTMLTNITARVVEKMPTAAEMILHYDEVTLVVRTLGDKTVLVVGEPHMNARMVSYSLNLLNKSNFSAPPIAVTTAAASFAPVNSDVASPVAVVDVAVMQPYAGELKHFLTKEVGPMADIIFDDAVDRWSSGGDGSFESFFAALAEEVDDLQQFDHFCQAADGVIVGMKKDEVGRG